MALKLHFISNMCDCLRGAASIHVDACSPGNKANGILSLCLRMTFALTNNYSAMSTDQSEQHVTYCTKCNQSQIPSHVHV